MPQHSASSSSRRFHYPLFDYDAKDYSPPVFQENPSSFIASQNPKNNPPPPSSSSTQATEHVKYTIETSESSQVICEICLETKRTTQMINNTCDHSYCSDCVTRYVATEIQYGTTVVRCPGWGCKSVFELEACLPWLPKDLLERWDKALCEALILQVPKCYCPFEDCSAMMLVENEIDQQTAGETECPVCHRMFCPRCNVSWHTGVDCKKYQKLNENKIPREDRLMTKLAKKKRWQRCPNCNFYVEKRNGCFRITCRCKYQFCYACGKDWTSIHVSCRGNRKNKLLQLWSSCFLSRVLHRNMC